MMINIPMRLFGGYFREHRGSFDAVAEDLIKARMSITLEQWLSNITFYALLLTLLGATLVLAAAALLFNYPLVWRHLFGEFNLSSLLLEFGLFVVAVPVCFLVIFYCLMLLPKVKAWERRAKIDGHLPYAIGWMSSMATSGVIPYMIFKKLAETEEYFGEVSQEAKLVVKDVELLGYDFIGALRNLSAITPSERLRSFVQGALTNTLSGGEMRDYFIGKAHLTMEENRKSFADFISTLEMIAEVYIIALVAAPLLIIVMFAAMMMLRGTNPMILMIIIYGAIPLGSMLFLLLIDSLTPEGAK